MESPPDDEWDLVVDRLSALGSSVRMPLSASLGDGLFELRFTLGPTARRITYRCTKSGAPYHLSKAAQQRAQ